MATVGPGAVDRIPGLGCSEGLTLRGVGAGGDGLGRHLTGNERLQLRGGRFSGIAVTFACELASLWGSVSSSEKEWLHLMNSWVGVGERPALTRADSRVRW